MSKCVLHFKNESIKKVLKVQAFKDTHSNYLEIHFHGSQCRLMAPLGTLTVAA